MTKRLVITLLLGLALTLQLGACGKKGRPVKPDSTYPHSYPKT